MAPVGSAIYDDAWQPYEAGDITLSQAGDRAWDSLSGFLLKNTREAELVLFDLATATSPSPTTARGGALVDPLENPEALPVRWSFRRSS